MTEVPAWLGHLRRDRRGLPIPFVNRMGPERPENVYVDFDPLIRQRAMFVDDTAENVPDFTAQSPQRQRYCVVGGFCQVCGRPIPVNRRYLVIARLSMRVVEIDGVRQAAITEPWLDRPCAEFAVEKCPALIRRKREEELVVYNPPNLHNLGVALSTGFIDGKLAAETKKNPVAMWAEILVPEIEVVML